jgi:hypothetical protein
MVGARGFEPPTTCTPCKYATRLRYAPKLRIIATSPDVINRFSVSILQRQKTEKTIHDLRKDTTLSISPCKIVKLT